MQIKKVKSLGQVLVNVLSGDITHWCGMFRVQDMRLYSGGLTEQNIIGTVY